MLLREFTMFVSRVRVLLPLFVFADIVMMGGLMMMVGGCVVMSRRLMMMLTWTNASEILPLAVPPNQSLKKDTLVAALTWGSLQSSATRIAIQARRMSGLVGSFWTRLRRQRGLLAARPLAPPACFGRDETCV